MTGNVYFDAVSFHAALDVVREERAMTWRQIAEETSISPSTLTRLGQGNSPDATGLASLCKWAGFKADDFLRDGGTITTPEQVGSLSQLLVILQAAEDVEDRDRAFIRDVLKALYKRLRNS